MHTYVIEVRADPRVTVSLDIRSIAQSSAERWNSASTRASGRPQRNPPDSVADAVVHLQRLSQLLDLVDFSKGGTEAYV
jgi:hypothetical protein